MGGCASRPRPSRQRSGSLVADATDWNQQYMEVCAAREKDKLSLSQISVKEEKRRAFQTARKRLQSFSKLSVVSLSEKSEKAAREVNGYKMGQVLGKGAYGSVYIATKESEQYAVKVMKRPKEQPVWHPAMKKQNSAANTIKVRARTHACTPWRLTPYPRASQRIPALDGA